MRNWLDDGMAMIGVVGDSALKILKNIAYSYSTYIFFMSSFYSITWDLYLLLKNSLFIYLLLRRLRTINSDPSGREV
jgi:hypothetical protein